MISPIEMYSMIPKSDAAAMQRQGELAKDNSQHVNGMQQFDNQTMSNSQKTVRMNETENPEYRYDGTEGNGQGYEPSGGKKQKEEEKGKKDKEGYVRSDGIDIRI
ncbi:MAG: hypothetical protein K5655_05200 [Lachnospiraceae bacterium]|nr:hypothetical protein [Lachnospiraceae bacterium]